MRRAKQEEFVGSSPPVKLPPTIEFKSVKLADLRIPIDIYQRPASRRAINRIKEMGWDVGLQAVPHMTAHSRVALPTDWSVKAEGILLALNTRAARIPRETLIPK